MKLRKILLKALVGIIVISPTTQSFAACQSNSCRIDMELKKNLEYPEILEESEIYGIYPPEWNDDDFLETITKEKLNLLISNTAEKISKLGLTLNKNVDVHNSYAPFTNGDVIAKLFSTISWYEEISETDAIQYFVDNNLLTFNLNLKDECSVEQAIVLAKNLIDDTYEKFDAGGKGYVYKVENKGNTVYLVGTTHSGIADMYPLNQKLLDAFYKADVVAKEINPDDEDMQVYRDSLSYTDGTTLKDHLDEQTYEKVWQVFELMEAPEEQKDLLKYTTILNLNELFDLYIRTLSNKNNDGDAAKIAKLQAMRGIDSYFDAKVNPVKQKLIGLETLKSKVERFASNSDASIERLNSLIDIILSGNTENIIPTDIASADLDKSLEAWANGDVEGFFSVIGEGISGCERDINFTKGIVKMLESDEQQTYFVMLGAAHYLLDNAVTDLLEEKGYTVENFYN
ncbi:MAG: hypothetical protein ATN32_01090 [Candidatus Epulonipiscium fishelsonii]|nr:MAG: hypothetical protein ATN32_01090 [Epulopiscium sp. AS2M-Bin002]